MHDLICYVIKNARSSDIGKLGLCVRIVIESLKREKVKIKRYWNLYTNFI